MSLLQASEGAEEATLGQEPEQANLDSGAVGFGGPDDTYGVGPASHCNGDSAAMQVAASDGDVADGDIGLRQLGDSTHMMKAIENVDLSLDAEQECPAPLADADTGET